ncbi:hypothetical protein DFH07DRAFT_784568 [Mycena maculata]|uniref:Uncharacterized protein n=1 Tax=Mycena maculata TaxID=230809 RepID=A0AAD7HFP8_9AGAR|nr:hypothetical protein DFH07DRAFT_784568 [Mycena maculata]
MISARRKYLGECRVNARQCRVNTVTSRGLLAAGNPSLHLSGRHLDEVKRPVGWKAEIAVFWPQTGNGHALPKLGGTSYYTGGRYAVGKHLSKQHLHSSIESLRSRLNEEQGCMSESDSLLQALKFALVKWMMITTPNRTSNQTVAIDTENEVKAGALNFRPNIDVEWSAPAGWRWEDISGDGDRSRRARNSRAYKVDLQRGDIAVKNFMDERGFRGIATSNTDESVSISIQRITQSETYFGIRARSGDDVKHLAWLLEGRIREQAALA